jgi:hypothetical protein
MPRCCMILLLFFTLSFHLSIVPATEPDQPYAERFVKAFPANAHVPTIEEYATQKRFDEQFLGDALDKTLTGINNDSAGIAWGISYLMMALNEMYQATGDLKYLHAMRKATAAVLDCRDDKRGVQLFTGQTAPIWSCLKYSERGRCAYAVHTGIITYPILDFLRLAASNSDMRTELGSEYDEMVRLIGQSLDFHDRQWSDGPNPGEGYYFGMDQEPSMDGKVIPANRLSSMGRALWLSSKLTNNTSHRNKAMRIARFIKNRLSRNTECDAYVWPYSLSREDIPVEADGPGLKQRIGRGEDISHGSLTVSFLIMAANDGEIYSTTDMARFGRTVTRLIAPRNDGVLFSQIDGDQSSSPDKDLLSIPSRWLHLTPYCPEVYTRIQTYMLNYEPNPQPLDLALLLRYRKFVKTS